MFKIISEKRLTDLYYRVAALFQIIVNEFPKRNINKNQRNKRKRVLHSPCIFLIVSLIFILIFSLPPLYLLLLFRNSSHSLLNSMMLLASGALYSNLFHALLILLCKIVMPQHFFSCSQLSNFQIFSSNFCGLASVKSLLGSILSVFFKIFKASIGLHEVSSFPLRICSTFSVFPYNLNS